MKFGQVLETVLKEQQQTQLQAGSVGHISNAMVSKIVRGTRKPAKDVMRRTVIHYDEARLTLAAQEEVSGEASVPWLNGADLHKAAVHCKTIEEVREAYEAVQHVPITKRQDQLADADREQIRKAMAEAVEAITALTHWLAILSNEYRFSYLGIWKDHRQELKSKKYLK